MNPQEILNAMEFSRESLNLLVENKQDFVMKNVMYHNFINIIWQIVYTPEFIKQEKYFTIVYEWSLSSMLILLWWLQKKRYFKYASHLGCEILMLRVAMGGYFEIKFEMDIVELAFWMALKSMLLLFMVQGQAYAEPNRNKKLMILNMTVFIATMYANFAYVLSKNAAFESFGNTWDIVVKYNGIFFNIVGLWIIIALITVYMWNLDSQQNLYLCL